MNLDNSKKGVILSSGYMWRAVIQTVPVRKTISFSHQ